MEVPPGYVAILGARMSRPQCDIDHWCGPRGTSRAAALTKASIPPALRTVVAVRRQFYAGDLRLRLSARFRNPDGFLRISPCFEQGFGLIFRMSLGIAPRQRQAPLTDPAPAWAGGIASKQILGERGERWQINHPLSPAVGLKRGLDFDMARGIACPAGNPSVAV
jgi:hypothetical protein